jgi:hypothetical protein
MEFEQLLAAALAGGSGVAAVWYIARLLVKASRDPKRLGAWLPRLLAGWHIGMTEVERARQEREEAKQQRSAQKPAKERPDDKVVASANDRQGQVELITPAKVRSEPARPLLHQSGASHRSRARHRVRT